MTFESKWRETDGLVGPHVNFWGKRQGIFQSPVTPSNQGGCIRPSQPGAIGLVPVPRRQLTLCHWLLSHDYVPEQEVLEVVAHALPVALHGASAGHLQQACSGWQVMSFKGLKKQLVAGGGGGGWARGWIEWGPKVG